MELPPSCFGLREPLTFQMTNMPSRKVQPGLSHTRLSVCLWHHIWDITRCLWGSVTTHLLIDLVCAAGNVPSQEETPAVGHIRPCSTWMCSPRHWGLGVPKCVNLNTCTPGDHRQLLPWQTSLQSQKVYFQDIQVQTKTIHVPFLTVFSGLSLCKISSFFIIGKLNHMTNYHSNELMWHLYLLM